MTDSNLPDKSLTDNSTVKKNKKKPKKESAWRKDGPQDPFELLDSLPEEKQQEFQKALHLFSVGHLLPRTIQDAKMRSYHFWSTQPVPKLGDTITSHGPIEEVKTSIRKEAYSLPEGFSWDTLDLTSPAVLKELCSLLNENYMEEDDNTIGCDFSPEYLQWALQSPGWLTQWHCGVRVNTNKKLVGFIAAIPANIRIYETEKRVVQVNFLCVHKKLRMKRMSPVLIRELTRRVNLQGVYQAVYIVDGVLPSPTATGRYWHRSLNLRKLMDVNYPGQRQNMALQRALKLNRLPEVTKTPGLRCMTRQDASGVHSLLQDHLQKFHLSRILSLEEVEHWLLPRENVIDTYVVEGSDGILTDVVSFCTESSRVLNHPVHSSLQTAHLLYCVSTATQLLSLMEDTLVLAKTKGFDVFVALNVMENSGFLERLKFNIGDRNCHYYLYNWACPNINPDKVGLLLPG